MIRLGLPSGAGSTHETKNNSTLFRLNFQRFWIAITMQKNIFTHLCFCIYDVKCILHIIWRCI